MAQLMVGFEQKSHFTELIVKQDEALRRASALNLAHGATVPSEYIVNNCRPAGSILELGSGTGSKLKHLKELGFSCVGLDINEEATKNDWFENAIPVFRADARHLWQEDVNPYRLYPLIEQEDGILIQGLLDNNPVNRDIVNILRNADVLLQPRGHLFIAEPIHYSELSDFSFDQTIQKDRHTLDYWQKKWLHRYEVNARAGLPYGIFAVAKGELPASDKERLDWLDDPDAVRSFIASDDFERFARHLSYRWLRTRLQRFHFREKKVVPAVMESRLGDPLLGVVSVWEKSTDQYKYRPFEVGETIQNRNSRIVQADYATELIRNPRFEARYLAEANKYLPPFQRTPLQAK
jgi:SAM-dependent methyltransferase